MFTRFKDRLLLHHVYTFPMIPLWIKANLSDLPLESVGVWALVYWVWYTFYRPNRAEPNIMASIGDVKTRPISDLDDLVELWVKRVVQFSSEYDTTGWAADNVIGEPRVYPSYGDIKGAWAQDSVNVNEFIVVEYDECLYISEVDIYETLNAGAITKIHGWDHVSSDWVLLWSTPAAQVIETSRIFTPELTEKNFLTNRLKLVVDCTLANTFCEIDAVKVKGKRTMLPKLPPLSSLSESLRFLVNNAMFSDVKFNVDGGIIYGHKAILAVRSEYFRAMFCNGLNEGEAQVVDIPGVSCSGFLGLMHYVYAHSFDSSLSPLNMCELFRVGDRFSLDGMKTLSYCCLSPVITVDNVIDVYSDAVENLPRLEDVEKLCIRFIFRNLNSVTKHPSFCDLPNDFMLQIIQEGTSSMSFN